MIELETELKELTPEDGYRLYAQRLQFWRLCGERFVPAGAWLPRRSGLLLRAVCRLGRGGEGVRATRPRCGRSRGRGLCDRSWAAGSAAWPRRCGVRT